MIDLIRSLTASVDVAVVDPNCDRAKQLKDKIEEDRKVHVKTFQNEQQFFEDRRFGTFDVVLMPLNPSANGSNGFRGTRVRVETYRRDPLTPVVIYDDTTSPYEQVISTGSILKSEDPLSYIKSIAGKRTKFEQMSNCLWSEAAAAERMGEA